MAAACRGDRENPAPPPRPAPAAPHVLRAAETTDWVPAEFKEGDGKWRDAGVYVDGVARGVLWFGELPEALAPVWLDDQRSVDFGPGAPAPPTQPVRVRRYRLVDYLRAIGVPVERVEAVHIYGGNSFVAAFSGRELRRVADRLLFGFGNETSGKPLIYFPRDLRTNTSFDHIAAIALYVDRPAPRVRPDGTVELEGRRVDDIPYHGEPLRGGVRVYKDDRLATWIKRRALEGDDRLAERAGDELRWNLERTLATLGVDTRDVVRVDVIFDERRTRTLDRAAFEGSYFTASPQARGKILLGAEHTPVQALALHSRPPPPHGAGNPGD